jgi:ABC-type hemin transport system substrate-binding protein
MSQMKRMKWVWMLLSLILAIVGCGKPAPKAIAPPATAPQSKAVSIVSLSPAITRTLADLQLAKSIVGRTQHCRAVDQKVPVVGDLVHVDYEQLVRLNPTHILVQPPSSGIDPHLVEVAKERGWKIAQWKLNTVDDIEQLVRDIPGTLFADGTPELAEASQHAAEMLNDIANAMTPHGSASYRGRLMIVNSVNPVLAAGSGTYFNDILVAQGGVNAVTERGWVQLSFEDVARINPEAIIVINTSGAEGPPELLGPLWDTQITAVLSRMLGAIRSADAQLPSSAVIEVAADVRRNLQFFAENSPQ